MLDFQGVQEIYPDLGKRIFTYPEELSTEGIKGVNIVSRGLLPLNHPEKANPFNYLYKNALIELSIMKDYIRKMDFLTQLHLIVLANTPTYKGKEDDRDVKLILFSDDDGDKKVKKGKGRSKEYLVAFYNGISIPIQRQFLEVVMGLENDKTIESYLNLIGCKYQKENSKDPGNILFRELAKSMVHYGAGEHNNNAVICAEILKAGKKLTIYMDRENQIDLYYSSGFYLNVTRTVVEEDTTSMGWGGLLEQIEVSSQTVDKILIDPVTANALMIYFFEEEDRFLDEGEDFLFHILAFYPK